ncbi:endoplasmin homolog [Lathyrus oleraceus]|uniref:endoplasmin homolog n=1 Tax=Pisum sativum TaxID=3888 RepID=UPI0021CF6BBD|nr:endoplasmin homolog [Pisum sativum]XP_050882103.1 endoplasmin homolog [Pisum sativum]XP_050883239.1 endoplasmin homolog [Pisum sativum]
MKETTYEWELLNDVKAVWLRSPKEVTEEEYTKFYNSLAKDFSGDKPLSWSHFTAEGEDEEEKPKTKTMKETTYEWELLNDVKAVWLRSPKEVTEEEYTKFYNSLAKDFSGDKPLSWSHFTAEGDVEFKAVLYASPKAPQDLYESYHNSNKSNLKLYVRRVFISDEFDELLPKYLSFLIGLVDSDTLPLNVSREMLQQHSSLRTIKKETY